MTNRLGDVRTIWIYGILAVLVLAGGLQGAGKIDIVTDWARLLPGFNQTIPEGTSIVGVNLATNDLMYFTGEKWRKIDIPKDNGGFVMGSYDFKPENMVLALSRFYFLSERRPSKLNLEINEWRYWEVVNGESKFSTVKINPHIKKIFIKNEKIPESNEYIDIDYANNRFYGKYSVSDIYTPFVAEIEYEKYPEKVAQVLAWRDSILEGEKCEKFLSLKVDEKKQGEKEKSYTVRKVDNYLFVDLSKPVSEGKDDSYKDGCLGVENYVDSKEILWDNIKPDIMFSFNFGTWHGGKSPANVVYSKRDGWSVDNRFRGHKSITSSNSFYENLILLIKPNGLFSTEEVYFDNEDNDGVFLNGNGKIIFDVLFLEKKEWQTLGLDKIDKFVYNVLTEYYSYYKIEEPKSTP